MRSPGSVSVRAWAVGSKLNAMPPIWPKRPLMISMPETMCSASWSRPSAVTVPTARSLLNRRELEMSSREMSPSSLPTLGFAAGGSWISSPPPPATNDWPMMSRMPPPFLNETSIWSNPGSKASPCSARYCSA